MAAGKKQEEKTAEPESQQTAVSVPAVEIVEESIHVLDFRVYATSIQLAGLKQYLKTNGIRFEPVPKQ